MSKEKPIANEPTGQPSQNMPVAGPELSTAPKPGAKPLGKKPKKGS